MFKFIEQLREQWAEYQRIQTELKRERCLEYMIFGNKPLKPRQLSIGEVYKYEFKR
jgi:hypothetical protein